jgi:hypothetical protein
MHRPIRMTHPKPAGGPTPPANPPPKMKQITALEFKKAVSENPAWATTLTEPVEITGYCRLIQSPITYLSPLLHFIGSGPNALYAATFQDCRHLKVAEGTFHGGVSFKTSRIERIGELTVTRTGLDGYAASFDQCKLLKVAEGNYPGHVDFSNSGITRINNLVITAANVNGDCADFCGCHRLKTARGHYSGSVCFDDSGIKRIGLLVITQPDHNGAAATFQRCNRLKTAEGTFPGSVDFTGSAIKRIGNLIITASNKLGEAASFAGCEKLKDHTQRYVDNPDVGLGPDNLMRASEGNTNTFLASWMNQTDEE